MKHLTQSRWWLPAMAALVLLALVACERPIPGSETATADPILPAIPVDPTTDPNELPNTAPTATAVPGTDPGAGEEATAVPEAPTTVPTETDQPRGEVNHTVAAGDTLTGLSLLYNVPVDVIVAANNLISVDSLAVGQVLVIPAEGTAVVTPTEPAAGATAVPPVTTAERTHIVQSGENLFRIGLQYGFTVSELASYNGIANPDRLDVGQVIKIPPSN